MTSLSGGDMRLGCTEDGGSGSDDDDGVTGAEWANRGGGFAGVPWGDGGGSSGVVGSIGVDEGGGGGVGCAFCSSILMSPSFPFPPPPP